MVGSSDASSGENLGIKPGSTKDELRAALNTLYVDMEKDPTAAIPWSVHKLLDTINRITYMKDPEPQQNGMKKHVGQQDGTNVPQRVAVFLSTRNGKVPYSDVYAALSGASEPYISQVLRRIKKGEVKIPSQVAGVTYRASGGRGFVVVEKLNTNMSMSQSRKPGRTIDRVLLFLYHNPAAMDSDIAGYAEIDESKTKGLVSRLIGYGFVDRESHSLTETGKAKAEKLESGERGESFLSRFGKYLAGQEGKDIDYSSVRAAFPGEKSPTVRMYFLGHVSGKHEIAGYKVIKTGENRIRVERLTAAQPEITTAANTAAALLRSPSIGEAASGIGLPSSSDGKTNYRVETARLYAAEAGSIEDVYGEFPELERLIGDRKGLEPNLLSARQNVRPEKVGAFYETIKKIPTEGSYLGRGHNDFFRLVINDRTAAERFMGWALSTDGLTPETVYAELDKYKAETRR